MKEEKTRVHFLCYTLNGVCKTNNEMPASAEGFRGWFCAANVIKNQYRHKKEDIEVSLKALREFLRDLKPNEEIAEKYLLEYL